MLILAGEAAPQDPWVAIILAAIPAVASIIAAYFGAVQFMRRRRERREGVEESNGPEGPPSPPVLPQPTTPPAVDPITMLMIEGLRGDIARERELTQELQRQRIADSGTIARLMAELSDAEARLLECIEANRRHEMDKEELRAELQMLRDRLNRMTRFMPEGNH